MKFNPDMLTLYAVTDGKEHTIDELYNKVESALKGGVTVVQLREKNISDEEYIQKARMLKPLCEKYGVPLIINDNADVAIASGADGVHVGIEDSPVETIRKKAPADFIIGATAKTVEQARAAEKAGADYLGVGAVFPSPTKKNAVRITVEDLQKITSSVSIPCVAIGGINGENITKIKGGGMKGAAVVSAIFSADDVEQAAKELKNKVISII